MKKDIPLKRFFAQTSSKEDLLEQLDILKSRGINAILGPYSRLISIDYIIKVTNVLKDERTKEEIYKQIVHTETGH